MVSVVISSLTFPYLVRQLGVEMYGLWSYVVAIGAFLDCVADPGLAVYATQKVAAERKDAFRLLPDVLALRCLCSLLAIAILLTIASLETRPKIRHLMLFYGIGLFLTNLLGSDYLLGALEMFHARSLLAVIQQSACAIGFFTLVRSPGDVLWLPACVLGTSIVTGIIGWIVLWRAGYKISPVLQPATWKAILVPGSHYAASSLMSSFYHRTGHVVVRWFLGDHALGIYSAAVRFVDLLRNFVIVVLNVLMPRMALEAKSGPRLPQLAKFAAGIMALISIPFTAGMISTAHLIVPWLLGPKYGESIPLLRWMSFYVITASAASLLAGTVLYAMGRHRAYLVSTGSGAATGVLLYLVLTRLWGLTGAGLAFVLAEVVVACVAYWQLPRELHDFWKVPPIRVAVCAGFLMVATVRLVESYTSQVLVVVAAGGVVYVTGCGWFVRRWLLQELNTT